MSKDKKSNLRYQIHWINFSHWNFCSEFRHEKQGIIHLLFFLGSEILSMTCSKCFMKHYSFYHKKFSYFACHNKMFHAFYHKILSWDILHFIIKCFMKHYTFYQKISSCNILLFIIKYFINIDFIKNSSWNIYFII